ncbi:hypothetical protein PR048_010272 [Dryococelus australis]|uniref:Aldehyde oxidase/xanthine dehydrogenase first molybdopterin binding domain-containing protein n=1 Tax=Dryococelus australis TaxID=614101 RepID=A0ABQ9I2A0_9NEOP|nr:hypothetical protein PR048_010272 [Dryococelus australis]
MTRDVDGKAMECSVVRNRRIQRKPISRSIHEQPYVHLQKSSPNCRVEKSANNRTDSEISLPIYTNNLSNARYSYCYFFQVMEKAMLVIANSYLIPNVKLTGYVCKTNISSNTAFRGFGAPQGMFVAENMIRDVARFLGKDPTQVAYMNLLQDGDSTHYKFKLENCTLRRCWNECFQRAQYESRKREVQNFNRYVDFLRAYG